MKLDRLIGGWNDECRQAVLAVRSSDLKSARNCQTVGLSSGSGSGFVSVHA